MLTALSQSRSEPAGRAQRASIILRYHAGDTISEIARTLRTNRPRVERCVRKALELGVTQALADLPGRGRRPAMTPEARAWVVALALSEAERSRLCPGTLDDAVSGQAYPKTLCRGWPLKSAQARARNGLQDSQRQSGASA